MADGIAVTEGAGKTVATDEVGSKHYQYVKLAEGADGTANLVSSANPLPVVQTGTPDLPTGAATAANQATGIAHLATLAGAVGGTEVQVDVLTMPTTTVTGTVAITAAALPLPTGAATSALQTSGNASLTTLAGAVAGTEVQADIVAALPTGANTIGKVIVVDGAGADPEFAKEGDTWNAADHGMIIFARDTDTNPDTYRAIQVDPDGHLKVNLPDALPAGTNNIGDVDVLTLPALPAGTNTIGATLDAGPAQTVTRTYTASADMTTAAAITPSPASGEKIVAMDILVSADTAMNFIVQEETSATAFAKVFLPANGSAQITLRGFLKAAVADKKLMGKASVAGNVAVTAVTFSEA